MTVVKLKVRRSAWRDLAKSKLPHYANNVVNLTTGKDAYTPIREKLTNLDAKSKALSKILDNVTARGQLARKQKELAIADLYDALESVAVGLEDNATNELYILEAGMELQLTRTRHDNNLLVVYKVTAMSNGQKGQAIVEFICPAEQRSQIQSFAVEWSDDGKLTWNKGKFMNAERILLTDLPSRKDIHFRVSCLGTHGRTSGWSDTAETFVI